MEKLFTLKLKAEQVNLIGRALGKLSWEEANGVIVQINDQVQQQLRADQETQAAGVVTAG